MKKVIKKIIITNYDFKSLHYFVNKSRELNLFVKYSTQVVIENKTFRLNKWAAYRFLHIINS